MRLVDGLCCWEEANGSTLALVAWTYRKATRGCIGGEAAAPTSRITWYEYLQKRRMELVHDADADNQPQPNATVSVSAESAVDAYRCHARTPEWNVSQQTSICYCSEGGQRHPEV